MTNYERIKSMSIEEVAKSRIKKYKAENDGGFIYFCGDFNDKDYPQHYFTDLFTRGVEEAEKRAIEAEIKWLEAEVEE